MREGYKPTPEDIQKAEVIMDTDPTDRTMTEIREGALERELTPVQLEILEECKLSTEQFKIGENNFSGVKGTVRGHEISLRYCLDDGNYEAWVEGGKITDNKVAKQLWDKYAKIAEIKTKPDVFEKAWEKEADIEEALRDIL